LRPQSLDIYLAADVVPGAQYRGGVFVPFGTNLAAALAGVPIRVFAADALGGHPYLNQMWTQLTTAQITTVAEVADFGSGPLCRDEQLKFAWAVRQRRLQRGRRQRFQIPQTWPIRRYPVQAPIQTAAACRICCGMRWDLD
jgi:hypothetical protein